MADKKISELTELTTPDGTEELVVNDSGVSKKIQIDNLPTTTLSDLSITATSTELNYVDGVTSNIQTQVDAKLPLAGGTMTGTLSATELNVSGELNLTATGNNFIDYTDNLLIRAAGSSPAHEYSIHCGKDGAVTAYHNGLAKLATTSAGVDVTGSVTMSSQPAFHVQNNAAFNSGSGVFPYAGVVTNIGSHYSTSTNRFTAPIAGTYLFEVSFFTNITNAPIDFRITKNGSSVGGNAAAGTHSLARNCHAGVVITLAVSDYVEVFAAGYGINTPAGLGLFQTFRGHLIG